MSTSAQIRQQFIDYFVQKHEHTFVPSSPVVPHGDPTLLFTNAGMNQFKDVFLATGERSYSRAANSQKCIRAGGKHNDLEDVGNDTYHHTFFEMLGNWSFGDYFKKEAIAWAWDLLTNVYGLDRTRLHATVFGGDEKDGLEPDNEAAELWRTVTDINPDHIHFCDKKDNFWEMGESGPCGPCSEIHIDLTPDKSGKALVNADDPRVIEIWNLVFIQFNRDLSGKLHPLPARHVDTGMGLERLCAVIQGKSSNYDTDLFTPIFDAIRQVTGAPEYGGRLDHTPEARVDTAYRVIADHIRALTFALTDGALPSNEGRGSVLRRILRRAVRHGYQTLEVRQPFLYKLVPAVVDTMGDAFPELKGHAQQVAEVIREEEEAFGKTIDRGIALFEAAAKNVYDADTVGGNRTISGEDAFKLHDTYGFPLDLTQVMAQERGLRVDVEEFHRLMREAQDRARAAGGHKISGQALLDLAQKEDLPDTEFTGYDDTTLEAQSPLLLFAIEGDSHRALEEAEPGREDIAVVTTRTPFYAEAGGQVGDTGTITVDQAVVRVQDTQKVGNTYIHLGKVERGTVRRSAEPVRLRFEVDQERRRKIMANHTATHVLNHKLREVLGGHVQQRGSLVDDDKTRFDFSHNAVVTAEQIEVIEQQANRDIAANLPVYAEYVPQEEALKIHGLRAVFGEKYPPVVRVVAVGKPVEEMLADPENEVWTDYSVEFCGGTHLPRTGVAEAFAIVGEEAVAKGVRRLVAITGKAAKEAASQGEQLLSHVKAMRQGTPEQLQTELPELQTSLNETRLPLGLRNMIQGELGELARLVKEHQKDRERQAAGDVVEQARRVAEQAEGDLVVAAVEGADARTLRTAMDVIRKKRPDAALLLGSVSDGKVSFLAAVPQPLIAKGLKAGDWVREVAKVAGGGGGGRPDMAQAGGKDPEKLDEALEVGRQFAAAKV